MASGLYTPAFILSPKLFSQFHSFFIKFAVFDIHSYSSPLIFVHTITGSTPAIVVFPRNHFQTFSLGQVVSITTWYSSTRSLRNSLSIKLSSFLFPGNYPSPVTSYQYLLAILKKNLFPNPLFKFSTLIRSLLFSFVMPRNRSIKVTAILSDSAHSRAVSYSFLMSP